MSRILLALVAVVVVVTGILTSSFTIRAQSSMRIEYAPVTPNVVQHSTVALDAAQPLFSYRACIARVTEWSCRDFKPSESSSEALRTALVQLGNEGWELVSVVEEDASFNTRGRTYLFKRQAR